MFILKIKYHLFALIKKWFYLLIFRGKVKFGKGLTFRKGFNLSIEGNGNIEIGIKCFFNNYCSINSLDKISIGHNSIFGENVKLYDHNHRFSDSSKGIMEQGYTSEPIIIGNNCWIGSNVTILKGVTIGDNVIVGAGCLINKDIPCNTIVKSQNSLLFEVRS